MENVNLCHDQNLRSKKKASTNWHILFNQEHHPRTDDQVNTARKRNMKKRKSCMPMNGEDSSLAEWLWAHQVKSVFASWLLNWLCNCAGLQQFGLRVVHVCKYLIGTEVSDYCARTLYVETSSDYVWVGLTPLMADSLFVLEGGRGYTYMHPA